MNDVEIADLLQGSAHPPTFAGDLVRGPFIVFVFGGPNGLKFVEEIARGRNGLVVIQGGTGKMVQGLFGFKQSGGFNG